MAADIFNARGWSDAGIGFVTSQPVSLIFVEIGSLDCKAQQPFDIRLLHVECQKNNMDSANCPDRDQSANFFS